MGNNVISTLLMLNISKTLHVRDHCAVHVGTDAVVSLSEAAVPFLRDFLRSIMMIDD